MYTHHSTLGLFGVTTPRCVVSYTLHLRANKHLYISFSYFYFYFLSLLIAAHSSVCVLLRGSSGDRESVIASVQYQRALTRANATSFTVRGKNDGKPAATIVRAALRASRTTRCPLTPSTRVRSTNRRVHLPVVSCAFRWIRGWPDSTRRGWRTVARVGWTRAAGRRRRDLFTCCFGVNTDTPKHNLMMRASQVCTMFIRRKWIMRMTTRRGCFRRRSPAKS